MQSVAPPLRCTADAPPTARIGMDHVQPRVAPPLLGTGEAAGKGAGAGVGKGDGEDEGEGVRRCDGRREGEGHGTR